MYFQNIFYGGGGDSSCDVGGSGDGGSENGITCGDGCGVDSERGGFGSITGWSGVGGSGTAGEENRRAKLPPSLQFQTPAAARRGQTW